MSVKRNLPIFLAGIIALNLAAFAGAPELPPATALPFAWRVQAASSPEIKPDPAKWKTIDKDACYGVQRNLETAIGLKAPASLWFSQDIEIPNFARRQSLWLSFQRIEGIARLYVNGKFVKELWRLDREADITDQVSPGKKAVISLYLTWTGPGTDRKYADDLILSKALSKSGRWNVEVPPYLGIHGQTSLQVHNRDSFIKDAWVETSWTSKNIKVHVTAAGQANPSLTVAGTILEESGSKVFDLPPQPFSPDGLALESPWENPIPWQLNSPHLYKLQLALFDKDGNKLESLPLITFGFR